MGDIVAIPLRGAWTGNRGIVHRGAEIVRFHAGSLWIACRLRYKDRWSAQWQPGHFTWLFFYGEALSLAAGHRPCALCRREEYDAYRSAVASTTSHRLLSAEGLDARLHGERLYRGTHRRRPYEAPWSALPDGVFVLVQDHPMLVYGDALVTWTAEGYGERHPRPRNGSATLITPSTSVAAIRGGYRPQIDPSAYRG